MYKKMSRVKLIISCLIIMVPLLLTSHASAIDVGAGIEVGGPPQGFVKKEVQNVSSVDGMNRVGDTLEYSITLSNDGPFSTWKDVNLIDTLPTGIDFFTEFGVIIDGVASTYQYEPSTRELTIPIGDLAGDDETLEGVVSYKDIVVVKLRATINQTASNTTITNHVLAEGKNSQAEAQDSGLLVESLTKIGAPVTVHYLDENLVPLTNSITLNGNIDSPFEVEQKVFNGYELERVEGPLSGVFKNEPQSTTFYYKKIAAESSSVIVKYVDDYGSSLSDDIELIGEVGTSYKTSKKEFEGYTLKEIIGDESGIFTVNEQTVKFVYSKNSSSLVIVKYSDEKGNSISDDVQLVGNIGDPYKTQPKEIEGYKLKDIQGNTEGVFAKDKITINYIYAKTGKTTTDLISNRIYPKSSYPTSISSVDKSNYKSLPKTGSKSSIHITLAGLTFLFSALFIFLSKRKKAE